jgi:DNA-binding transcriptional MerR regulator
MDTLPIEDIARKLEIPVETIRSYALRFALFIPAVRNGAEIRYPPAGVTLLGEIADAVRSGVGFDEIEASLQAYIPVTVVAAPEPAAAPPSAAPLDELLRLLDEQRRTLTDQLAGLGEAIDRLATADQFHGLRAETASLAAALAQRDAELVYANAVIVAELREAFGLLRREIAELRDELRAGLPPDRAREDGGAVAEVSELPEPAPVAAQPPSRPAGSSPRRSGSRTPRRMGQPLRLNGVASR